MTWASSSSTVPGLKGYESVFHKNNKEKSEEKDKSKNIVITPFEKNPDKHESGYRTET